MSRSSLPTLEADAATQALAAAWSALYEIEADALAQIAAAPADADALKAAVKRLDEEREARAAVVEAHAALVATYPRGDLRRRAIARELAGIGRLDSSLDQLRDALV